MSDLLREITVTHPQAIADGRRWFEADRLELFVWHDRRRALRKFELYYRLAGSERALVWARGSAPRNLHVDEDGGGSYHKAAPLMGGPAPFEREPLARRFAQAAGGLPGEIRALVGDAIERYPEPPVQAAARKPWWMFWRGGVT